jgi:hypothetical protein
LWFGLNISFYFSQIRCLNPIEKLFSIPQRLGAIAKAPVFFKLLLFLAQYLKHSRFMGAELATTSKKIFNSGII